MRLRIDLEFLLWVTIRHFFKLDAQNSPKALEYKVGRVLAPSIESICCGFQNDISDLLKKLLYCELNKKNQLLRLIKYKIWLCRDDQNYCSEVIWTPKRKILFVFDFIHFILSNTVITSVLTLSWEPTLKWSASFSSVSFHWRFELRFTVNNTIALVQQLN